MSDVNIIAESIIFFLTDIILNENDCQNGNETDKKNNRQSWLIVLKHLLHGYISLE